MAESHLSFKVRQLCFDLKTQSCHFVAFCRTEIVVISSESERSESEPNTPLKQEVATVAKTEPNCARHLLKALER